MTMQQGEGPPLDHQEEARRAVSDRIAELGLNANRIAEETGRHRSVISRFLRGESWPERSTLELIDRVLGWQPGTIDALSRGSTPPAGTETLPAAAPGQALTFRVSPTDKRILIGLSVEDMANYSEAELDEIAAEASAAALLAANRAKRAQRPRT